MHSNDLTLAAYMAGLCGHGIPSLTASVLTNESMQRAYARGRRARNERAHKVSQALTL